MEYHQKLAGVSLVLSSGSMVYSSRLAGLGVGAGVGSGVGSAVGSGVIAGSAAVETDGSAKLDTAVPSPAAQPASSRVQASAAQVIRNFIKIHHLFITRETQRLPCVKGAVSKAD